MTQQTLFNSDFGLVFFAMMGVFALSLLYPMNRELPYSRLIASLATTLLPLWWLYEKMIPPYMNIRVDLLIIIPLVIVSILILGARLPWLLRIPHPPNDRS